MNIITLFELIGVITIASAIFIVIKYECKQIGHDPKVLLILVLIAIFINHTGSALEWSEIITGYDQWFDIVRILPPILICMFLYSYIQENALEEMELQRLIVDSSINGIILTDPNKEDNPIVFANPAFEKISGYSKEEILGRNCRFLQGDDRNQPELEKIRKAIKEKTPVSALLRNYRKDGLMFWNALKVSPVINENNRLSYFLGVQTDITDLKNREAMLSESERRLNTVINNVTGMVYRCKNDRDWTMEYISENCWKLTGYKPDQLIDNAEISFADLIHPNDRDIVWKITQEALNNSEAFELKYRLVTANKEEKVVREQGIGIWSREGELQAIEGFIQDTTPLHNLSADLEYELRHDNLTKLWNRRELVQQLKSVIAIAQQEETDHGLCLIDLDQFKLINEGCGPDAADEMLRQIGNLIKNVVTWEAIKSRFGGDEFCILLKNCPPDRVQKVAENIRKAIENSRFTWNTKKYDLTASIGVVIIDHSTNDLKDVLQYATQACNIAKDLGRNRVYIYDIKDEILSRRQLDVRGVSLINDALENNRFQLFYQSIIPLEDTNNRLYFELLIRMKSEEGEFISPMHFIPAAERFGLSGKLDRWVIESAFSTLSSNHSILDSVAHCGINLSGQSMSDYDLLEFINDSLNYYKITPHKICFEVTETAAIENLVNAKMFIENLRKRGCHFALDDFGAGMSSFAYLRALDVDYLKIDGQFIKNIVDDPVDFETVNAINRVGKVMRVQTIAEFVEDENIVNKLKEIGIDYAQGYHFGKPEPLENLLIPDVNLKE